MFNRKLKREMYWLKEDLEASKRYNNKVLLHFQKKLEKQQALLNELIDYVYSKEPKK